MHICGEKDKTDKQSVGIQPLLSLLLILPFLLEGMEPNYSLVIIGKVLWTMEYGLNCGSSIV